MEGLDQKQVEAAQAQQQKAQQISEQRLAMMDQVLDKAASTRLGGIRAVNPDKA